MAFAGSSDASSPVLVVEDDPDVARVISQRLRAIGYATLCVQGGAQALAEIGRQRVSLVLLDWRLKDEPQGAALVRQLKAACRYRLPIVVISADPAALTEASQAGVEDYLPKPFQLDDLVAVVDEHCQ